MAATSKQRPRHNGHSRVIIQGDMCIVVPGVRARVRVKRVRIRGQEVGLGLGLGMMLGCKLEGIRERNRYWTIRIYGSGKVYHTLHSFIRMGMYGAALGAVVNIYKT